MRDYGLMRKMLAAASRNDEPFGVATAISRGFRGDVLGELRRLQEDGLVEGDMEFDGSGGYERGDVKGLTDEGRRFYRLVESGDVWAVVLDTLNKAGIDVPYPLLKEVCEEVVKRYVTSFIPDISRRGL